jgi:AraC family L-rhamnose operon regulatory protein RhaS
VVPESPWNLSLSTQSSPFTSFKTGHGPDLSLITVRKGRGWLNLAGSRTPVVPGQFIVLTPNSEGQLSDEPNDPLMIEELRVGARVLEVASLDPERLPTGVIELDPDRASRLASLLRRVKVERQRDLPHSCALATSLTLRLLADLAADRNRHLEGLTGTGLPWYRGNSMARMRSYVQDLEQHYFEATDLNAAASSLGLSRRRFTQLFRQVTDSSWLAHVRKLRIQHAQRLLTEPHKTVLSIAFECGFEDLSTFYRAFKREVGVSPNLWRKG